MTEKTRMTDNYVRDGIESLPEMEDLPLELAVSKPPPSDKYLDEGLLETFPASDPLASGRTE